ncbi:GTP cyclohydrolase I FolE [Calidifontibacillus erzurumensis]|uniref:GTP cyclohydrolase 1 n=1 Tax=Calidifontibacillus erzurumensis TaxID=2741433 RepID=A0A8J8GFT9_9BACI|nr:GTP cyclohydrolase I FolE [Calidifontibacillus erzurumensis]NSL50998.1 GTP cyclohydrolase I FolE [Calidifontibacillus erzurumensis]
MSITEKKLISQKILELFGDDVNFEKKLVLSQNVLDGFRDLIELCGDDPTRDGLHETPFRVLKAFLEYTVGYRENPKEHLEKVFDVNHQELVLVRDIEFYSMCEHHFAPFFGVAHVGYIPQEKITGLSKIGRMVEGYARRFQVQERLTNQIADAIEEVLKPQGTMVVVEAKHMCMCGRGIKKANSSTTTTAVRGVFAHQADARIEFLSLLNR